MRGRPSRLCALVAGAVVCPVVTAAGQEQPVGKTAGPGVRVPAVVNSRAQHDGAQIPADQLYSLPDDVEVRTRVVVAGSDKPTATHVGATSSGEGARLVYSNTLGRRVFGPEGPYAQLRISDDIITTAFAGCALDHYVIMVSGDRYGEGVGPFGVDVALYEICPGADGGESEIPGTAAHVELPDNGTYVIVVVIPPDVEVPLPSSFYLGVSFSRDECGIVVGAPAIIGFSADRFDFPGWPCRAPLGPSGYPDAPHASFYAEVYVRGDCPAAFHGYRSSNQARDYFSPGADVWFADDIELAVSECDMVAYEVGMRGNGLIEFDIRTFISPDDPASGGVIPGTFNRFLSFGSHVQIARFEFDPPISIPRRVWMVIRTVAGRSAGPIVTDRPAALGQTEDLYAYFDTETQQWFEQPFRNNNPYAAFEIAIECAGEPPSGACCDTVLTDNEGEAVCRQLPEMNCPANRWKEERPCDPDPFIPACGLSACCTPEDTCEDLTENECLALVGPDEPILWRREQFCGDPDLTCPFYACMTREGECTLARPEVGCRDPFCCEAVCGFDPWCCQVEWDEVCVRWSWYLCAIRPSHNECRHVSPWKGARLVTVPTTTDTNLLLATESDTDPGFCCHNGPECPDGECVRDPPPSQPTDGRCIGGSLDGERCDPSLGPGSTAFATVWYKFVAPEPSVNVSTCPSTSPADDSLISVYSVADPDRGICADGAPCGVDADDCVDGSTCELDEQFACENLVPIGCSDDVASCSSSGRNASLCLEGLTVGDTYYVMVGSKRDPWNLREPVVIYSVSFSAGCVPDEPALPNDYCHSAKPLAGANVIQPFDLSGGDTHAGATLHCPAEPCVEDFLENDLWYDWTAPYTGEAIVTTCAEGVPPEEQVNTTMVVYDGCECPAETARVLGCNFGTLDECGVSATVRFETIEGNCYTIRLGGHVGGEPAGDLTITCTRACPEGTVEWLDPPDGVVDARSPNAAGFPGGLRGIQAMVVAAPSGSVSTCWSFCETNVNPSLHPEYPSNQQENSILRVLDHGDGTYTIRLNRPITPGEITAITYTDDRGVEHTGRFASHPANVNGNDHAGPSDILAIIDILNGAIPSPWGIYSKDINHFGLLGPTDILALIHLLEKGWLGTTLREDEPCP